MEELRKSKNWSSTKMGEKVGVDYRTIRRYETNSQKPTYDIIEQYADIFDVSLDYLFYGIKISDNELLSEITSLSEKQKEAVMMVIKSYQ